MTAALSPRELVSQLNLTEIDASIEAVKGELVALEALRRVAVARDEGTLGNGQARVSAGSRSDSLAYRSRSAMADQIEEVLRQNGGTMRPGALRKAIGTSPNSSSFNRAIDSNPERFKREWGSVSLVQTDGADSRSSTEPSSTE